LWTAPPLLSSTDEAQSSLLQNASQHAIHRQSTFQQFIRDYDLTEIGPWSFAKTKRFDKNQLAVPLSPACRPHANDWDAVILILPVPSLGSMSILGQSFSCGLVLLNHARNDHVAHHPRISPLTFSCRNSETPHPNDIAAIGSCIHFFSAKQEKYATFFGACRLIMVAMIFRVEWISPLFLMSFSSCAMMIKPIRSLCQKQDTHSILCVIILADDWMVGVTFPASGTLF